MSSTSIEPRSSTRCGRRPPAGRGNGNPARALEAFGEQWSEPHYGRDGELVFGHPALGTPLDPSKLARAYMRPALSAGGNREAVPAVARPQAHALTHEASAGNPGRLRAAKGGALAGSITERYIHAAQVLFPGAAKRGESRIFAQLGGTKSGTNQPSAHDVAKESPAFAGLLSLPG